MMMGLLPPAQNTAAITFIHINFVALWRGGSLTFIHITEGRFVEGKGGPKEQSIKTYGVGLLYNLA
jgi:hypothetical protein